MIKLKTIDVALYIFIFTITGYFINFSYNWGYYNHFSIPLYFMDFSIFNITKSVSLIAIGIAVISILGIFFLDKTDFKWLINKPKILLRKRKINFSLQIIIAFCFTGVIIALSFEPNSNMDVFYWFAAMFLLMIFFILKKYLKAMIVSIIAIILMAPYILGTVNAMNQSEFFVMSEDRNYVILTHSDDNIILAKYNSENNTIYPEFKILSVSTLAKQNSELILFEIDKPSIGKARNFIDEN